MKFIKNIWPFLVVLILSYWTVKPLLNDKFFPMHDDTQPARVFEMHQSLKDGQFPVRWVKDLGYGFGYPLFNFYSPLPYYIGATFMFLEANEIISAKLMIGMGLLLAGIGMYILGQSLWGKAGGLISAISYVYAPYHAVQSYVRGASGELYAYALIPFIFYFLVHHKLNFNLRVVGGGIFWAALILSHNVSSMLAVIFFVLWVIYLALFYKENNKEFKLSGATFLLGLGLAAFFWLPALVETKFTQVDLLTHGGSDFHQHFIYLNQLWDSPWGYAGSAAGEADGMSFKIGKIQLLLAAITILFLITSKSSTNRKLLFFLIPVSLISVWLMTKSSQVLWEIITPLAYAQYPWRILVFLLMFLAMLGGGAVMIIKDNKLKVLITSSILGLLIFVNQKYFTPQYLYKPDIGAYSAPEKLNWEISKISDEYMTADFVRPDTKQDLLTLSPPKNAIIRQQEIRSHRQKLVVDSDVGELIQLKIADFPGWKLVIDEVEVLPVKHGGILYVSVPPGQHLITAYLANTPIRTLGNFLSVFSLIGIFVVMISSKKKIFYGK